MRIRQIREWALAATILVAVLGSPGCATTGQTAQNGALVRARAALDKGDYQFALERLAAAETYVSPSNERKAEIGYLKGICYEGLGENKLAEGLFREAANLYPETEFGVKAAAKLAEKTP